VLLFAVIRAIEVIGEAASKISDETPSLVLRDTAWDKLINPA
jgi:uncharacterized protein with HEPN domain